MHFSHPNSSWKSAVIKESTTIQLRATGSVTEKRNFNRSMQTFKPAAANF